jgi:hypothetical protein
LAGIATLTAINAASIASRSDLGIRILFMALSSNQPHGRCAAHRRKRMAAPALSSGEGRTIAQRRCVRNGLVQLLYRKRRAQAFCVVRLPPP